MSRWLGKFFGGVFGVGGKARINEALARVKQKFAEGDRDIDVIGFSRGAAIALDFVNALESKGYPQVRFLGLWDVVASFGIPINVGPIAFQKINLGYKLKLPKIVKHCYHAIALDERRQTFRVTRVKGAYEVWFRGVHSDVGGGNQNEALSNIALRWMVRKALAVGVPVDKSLLTNLSVNPAAEIKPSMMDLIPNEFRPVPPSDWIHYTLTIRKHPDCQNAPAGCPIETIEHEERRTLVI